MIAGVYNPEADESRNASVEKKHLVTQRNVYPDEDSEVQ